MTDDEVDWNRVGKLCPHCGVRGRTLGSSCPACGKSYQPFDLLDLVPLDDLPSPYLTARLWFFVTIAAVAVIVLLFLRSWQAGVLVLAALLVLLVAAIGFTNWRAQR